MEVNVGEGHVDDKSRFVLREAPVSHFAKAKDVLNHSKDVFHSAADSGLRPVALSVLITEWPVPMTLALGKVFRFASFAVYPLLLTTICTVTINPLLFPMKKAFDDSRVMHVGRSDFHGVHHLALTVSSDVTFHPKVPFIAFLGLMHLRIAFSFFVFGGRRRGDDGGIHDRPGLHAHAFVCKVGIDDLKNRVGQVVVLKEVTEVEDGGFIWRSALAEVDPDKTPNRHRVIEFFFKRGIGKVIPLLNEVSAQHETQINGLTTNFS